MIRLALLRHGPTPWNAAGRLQGRSDIALSDEARAALAGLRLPAPWINAALWASPLARARETADLVSGRKPQVSDALIEMNWGDWEGQRGVDLLEDPKSDYRHIEDWGWSYRPPGGETPAEMRERIMSFVDTLQEDAVIVSHIGIMRVLLALAHGWDFDGPAPFRIKRNRLFLLRYEAGVLRALPGDPPRLVPVDAAP